MIKKWFRKFNENNFDISLKKPIGRKCNVNYFETVKNIVNKDRSSSVRSISKVSKISRFTVSSILKEKLKMKRKKSKLIPHVLSKYDMKRRIKYSKENIPILNNDNNMVITGDETILNWTNDSMYKWYLEDEDLDVVEKNSISSKKSMICVFLSKNGIEFIDIIPGKQTMNGDYFLKKIIQPMVKKMKGKYRNKNIFLHYDNAPPHRPNKIKDYLSKNNISIMRHPPYSPDLAPLDFFYFSYFKNILLKDLNVKTEKELKDLIMNKVKETEPRMFNSAFKEWIEKLKRVLVELGAFQFSK
jgi:histone-lysine N-methyltransferase SETMAR